MPKKPLTLIERKTKLYNKHSGEIQRLKKTRPRYPKGSEAYRHYTRLINLCRETQRLLDNIFEGEEI